MCECNRKHKNEVNILSFEVTKAKVGDHSYLSFTKLGATNKVLDST